MRLALLFVVVLAGRAHAEGQAPKSAPRPRCEIAPIKGTPLFEARYIGGSKGRSVTTKLYSTGTFTRLATSKPKTKPETQTSCIEKTRVAELLKRLDAAPWKILRNNEACQATSAESTEIFVAGKKRFTVKTCNHLALDEESNAALDTVGLAVGPFGIDVIDDDLVETN